MSPPEAEILSGASAVQVWADAQKLDRIIMPHAPVGPMRETVRTLEDTPPLSEQRRPVDSAAWPLATAGFF